MEVKNPEVGINNTPTYFRKINVNPKNRITQDCVIRALSLFLNQDYYKVLDDLFDIYKSTGFHIADPVCFMIYLKRITTLVRTNIIKEPVTLDEFCEKINTKSLDKFPNMTVNNCNKVLVLLGNTHLTYIENGYVLDTYKHSTMNVTAYYTVKEQIL